jgi:putative OmpL-like beta-barrel porin-2
MKISHHSLHIAVWAGLLASSTVWAQTAQNDNPLRNPMAGDSISFLTDSSVELSSFGDCQCGDGCDSCSDCDCGSACGCGSAVGSAPKPWSLPQPCCLQNHGIRLGGWLQQGITFNADRPADRFNGPVATNDLDTEYQMNQMWLYLTKAADNGGSGWALGGHMDMLFGTDWRFGINHGIEDRINGFHGQTYGTVIPQAYVEIAYNALSVKLGHFAAILDYEMVPAPFNPFYSHSYSYGYTVPQLVTGVLGDYKLSDQFSVQAGFTRGWSMFEDYNDDLDFMGGVKWISESQKTSLAFAVNTGAQDSNQPPYTTSGENNRFVYSLVAKQKLGKKLEYILVHNLGIEENMPIGPTPMDAEWYGINQYLLYTLSPTLQANLRAEWMRDDDGARIAGPGNINGVRAWDGAGYAGNFYEVTAGLLWRPCPNVMVRPEVRWDWYKGLASPKPGNALPFDNGTDDDQFLVATDIIFTF